jgi:hypothetical protein
MFAWWIDTDVAESLVGSDEEPAFILDGKLYLKTV